MPASVRVMNSYDYCHFEIVLSADGEVTPKEVDEMRKTAQRLVDKAIGQYTTAKDCARRATRLADERRWVEADVKSIREIPEGERSAEQKASLKAWEDRLHELNVERDYDYDDDEEYEF
jgi:hypothetical protein